MGIDINEVVPLAILLYPLLSLPRYDESDISPIESGDIDLGVWGPLNRLTIAAPIFAKKLLWISEKPPGKQASKIMKRDNNEYITNEI